MNGTPKQGWRNLRRTRDIYYKQAQMYLTHYSNAIKSLHLSGKLDLRNLNLIGCNSDEL